MAPDPPHTLARGGHNLETIDRLRAFYKEVVAPDLRRAQTNAAMLDSVLRELDGWMYFVESNGLKTKFAVETEEAKQLLPKALERAAVASTDRCFGQKRPEEGFALLRWVRYARKYLPGSPMIAAIEARLTKCLKFELKFHSIITESAPGYGYYYEVRSTMMLRASASTRATGSGRLDWVDFHWIGGPCAFATQGESSTFDAASAGFGFSMAPVSRTSPTVKLALHSNPGVPYEHTTMSCPGTKPISWHTDG
jgi:hypothetical protein